MSYLYLFFVSICICMCICIWICQIKTVLMSILLWRQQFGGEREVRLSRNPSGKNAPSGVIIRNTNLLLVQFYSSHSWYKSCRRRATLDRMQYTKRCWPTQTEGRVCLWVTHRPSLCRWNTNLGWIALLLHSSTLVHWITFVHCGTFIHKVLLYTNVGWNTLFYITEVVLL